MGDVVSIGKKPAGPRLRVIGGSADGASINAYLIPRQVAEDIATGTLPVDTLPEAVWQTIIGDWLAHIAPEVEQ